MKRRFLEDCLAKGMSLEAIGELADRHPSTVSYWLKKYGLRALGAERHTPSGAVDPIRVPELIDAGLSIRQMAAEFGVGYSTMRYWLQQLGVETDHALRQRESEAAKEAGLRRTRLKCPKHGRTTFFARQEGGFRCGKCNTAAVSARRREVKRQLVAEAGGSCRVCGFSEHQAALQFHHVDPTTKDFHLAHQGISRSISRMRDEAAKCVLLCANCHALIEAGVRELPP